MNGYKLSTPRAALGLTAVAMAAITMGVFVMLPANLDHVGADPYALAAAKAVTGAPIDVASSPARIDVPEVVNREDPVQPGRTTLGAQEFSGKRTHWRVAESMLGPHDRTYNTQVRVIKLRIFTRERP
jgi:hypothetical protein